MEVVSLKTYAAGRPEGYDLLTILLDFSAGAMDSIDLSADQRTRAINARTVFCDLSKCDSDLTLTPAQGVTPAIICRRRMAGYYPCLFDAPLRINATFAGAAQQNPLPIQFYSQTIPGPVWGVSQ